MKVASIEQVLGQKPYNITPPQEPTVLHCSCVIVLRCMSVTPFAVLSQTRNLRAIGSTHLLTPHHLSDVSSLTNPDIVKCRLLKLQQKIGMPHNAIGSNHQLGVVKCKKHEQAISKTGLRQTNFERALLCASYHNGSYTLTSACK